MPLHTARNNHPTGQGKLTAIDLFSGCGGLTVGLKRAGFRVLAAVEMERKARTTYLLNHPEVIVYDLDIRALSAKTVMSDLNIGPGELDLLAGCPPCQGFSRLRTRNKGSSVIDPRNDLISEIIRFTQGLMPKALMLENVPALQQDSKFRQLCNELEKLRYACSVNVLDVADYSVPQRRKRLVLLASRVHSPAPAEKSHARLTVRSVLYGLDNPKKSGDSLHAVRENRSKRTKALIRLIPRNGGSRSDLPSKFQLACHQLSDGFHDVYGRMAWDEVSPTITSGCINPSKGRFLHPTQNRTITLREASLLQGFPSNYKFDVSHGKEAIALMIGNALPPPFVEAHARAMCRSIRSAMQSTPPD
jgi:DNA (cytosine-5)-methyltransferase 1